MGSIVIIPYTVICKICHTVSNGPLWLILSSPYWTKPIQKTWTRLIYFTKNWLFLCKSPHKAMTTFRLEARLMIDRWRSLFLWAGVSSGSEAVLSKWQTHNKLTYITTIHTAGRKTADYINALVKTGNTTQARESRVPLTGVNLFSKAKGSMYSLILNQSGERTSASGGQYLVTSFVVMVTFIVAVGSIRKKIQELVDWSMGTRLQLEKERERECEVQTEIYMTTLKVFCV